MSTTIIKPELFHPESSQDKPAVAPRPWHQPLQLKIKDWLQNKVSRKQGACPALLLELPDRSIKFHSLAEFSFTLASRTDYPVARMRALMKHTPEELEQTAQNIHDIEREFSDVIAKSAQTPHLIGEFFAEFRIKLFSQDHDWRDIMDGLRRLSPEHNEYKQVALAKYMQYLRSRQQILKNVFMEKTRDDDSVSIHATPTDSSDSNLEHMDHKTTAIFDVTHRAASAAVQATDESNESSDSEGLISLDKGESCQIKFIDKREIQLSLAGNYFKLYCGKEFYLADDGGNTYPLQMGKNLVGRHSGCDVVVDEACRSVSRHHLIIEPVADDAALLTDLSAHGTEIPANAC